MPAAAIAALVIPLSQVASAHTATRAASGAPKPTIVLEHGAWANTASWAVSHPGDAVEFIETAAAAVLAGTHGD